MVKPLQALRGMNDILPEQTPIWRYLEDKIKALLASYCYSEIRTPIVEFSSVFSRGIGAGTDVVEKEMYTFQDRNGESLSLRPEATAGCVRASVENGLLFNQVQRLWSMGPMYRHERPQKGRYRQFHQVSVEAFGMNGPDIDAELILLTARLWKELGLCKHLTLELNTLGSLKSREKYKEDLVAYLSPFQSELDKDSCRRLTINPLRILDSKDEQTQNIVSDAPVLWDYIDDESIRHFEGLCNRLVDSGIEYKIKPRLVRGLDYYSRTVFEWVTDSLGAQGTVCAGGRYDMLVEMLGGKRTFAVGFALGMERLLLMLENLDLVPDYVSETVDIAFVSVNAGIQLMSLVEQLRDKLPKLKLLVDCSDASFKAQMKRANRSGAKYALIIEDGSINCDMIIVRPLQSEEQQTKILKSELADYFKKVYSGVNSE